MCAFVQLYVCIRVCHILFIVLYFFKQYTYKQNILNWMAANVTPTFDTPFCHKFSLASYCYISMYFNNVTFSQFYPMIWTYRWWANLKRWIGRVKQQVSPRGSFNCRISIINMSPAFEPTAKTSLFDMCQATDVNSCDLLLQATEICYKLLYYKD